LTEDPPLSGLSTSSCTCVICAGDVGDVGDVDMMASEVLTLERSPCFAAPKNDPVLSFDFCDAVLTGVDTIPKLLGLPPCLFAASMLTLAGIAGTGGGGSSD
jgi:hypothetical protein